MTVVTWKLELDMFITNFPDDADFANIMSLTLEKGEINVLYLSMKTILAK